MPDHLRQSSLSSEMEREFEWDKWRNLIPALPFKEGWKIRIIPPSGGAIIRFRVIFENSDISVYLDAYDHLGVMGKLPYWEIYPAADGDCERFGMTSTDELIAGIQASIDANKPKDVI